MQDPLLAKAATGVLELAAAVLAREPRDRRFAGQVEGYLERWTARGRSPADDAIEHLTDGPADGLIDGLTDGPTGGSGVTVGEQIGDLP